MRHLSRKTGRKSSAIIADVLLVVWFLLLAQYSVHTPELSLPTAIPSNRLLAQPSVSVRFSLYNPRSSLKR
jgi:hypothetical protein